MNWLIVIVTLAVIAFLAARRAAGRVSGLQAQLLVREGALLIDVRSDAEFRAGHIEGARNIPLDALRRDTSPLGAKSAPVVVYCASGMRSSAAVRALRAHGFTAAHDMGPMSAWPR